MSLSHPFSNVIALLVLMTLCKTKWDHCLLLDPCESLESSDHDPWSLV